MKSVAGKNWLSNELQCDVIRLAELAGEAITQIAGTGRWRRSEKPDSSPVTEADLAAHDVLVAGLRKLSDLTVISEEDSIETQKVRPAELERFWLVDPLDGTRDFVAGRDSYVTCVALIENKQPVFGIIHAPKTRATWWAVRGAGCFGPDGERVVNHSTRHELLAVGSRSMPSERMQELYKNFAINSIDRFGSALKFCKVADGTYDIYPRLGPTSEWDTAAGQIILEEAGCKFIDLTTQAPMSYGKPQFKNSGFIAARGDLLLTPFFQFASRAK